MPKHLIFWGMLPETEHVLFGLTVIISWPPLPQNMHMQFIPNEVLYVCFVDSFELPFSSFFYMI